MRRSYRTRGRDKGNAVEQQHYMSRQSFLLVLLQFCEFAKCMGRMSVGREFPMMRTYSMVGVHSGVDEEPNLLGCYSY